MCFAVGFLIFFAASARDAVDDTDRILAVGMVLMALVGAVLAGVAGLYCVALLLWPDKERID